MSQLEEYAIFVSIARAGSMTAASRQVGLAKSAVSKKLSDLEQRLGVQLLERTTRSMTLTQAGEVFLTRAEQILDDVAEAEAEAQSGAKALSGRLRIAAPLSFGLLVLKPMLSKFIQEHPEIHLEIDFADRKVDLVQEGFDMALRIGTLTDSSLIARKVGSVRHIAAASPSFWDTIGRPKEPIDLLPMPCLRYNNNNRARQIDYKTPGDNLRSFNPNVRIQASNGEILASLASDGLGYLVEPDFILKPFLDDGRLEPVLLDTFWEEMDVSLIYPPSRRVSARARSFSNYLLECFTSK
ncbi:MAG: LysR family transcriptional regulator [Pseudomonadota bacterium]